MPYKEIADLPEAQTDQYNRHQKEAFLKAKGTGLSGNLDEVEIALAENQRVRIDARVPGWTLMELNPGGTYEAAVVVEGGSLPVNCYRWEPTR